MQQQPPPYLLPAILVAFPLVFALIWLLVSILITTVSGWRSMAQRYPCPEGHQGTPIDSGHAIRVGWASYRGIISMSASPQGLKLKVMWLFPFHDPLLIPWDSISLERGGGLFSAGQMHVRDGSTFHLNGDALRSIEQSLAARGVFR